MTEIPLVRASAPGIWRVWWPVLAVGAYALAIDLWIAANWRADPGLGASLALWDAVPPLAAAAVLTLRLAWRPQLPPARRWAWISLGTGLIVDLIGSTMLAVEATTGTAQVVGAGDLVYWLAYPLFAMAMAMFFVDVGGSFRRPLVWLDAAMLAMALGVTMWEFVGRPHFGISVAEPGETLAAAAYGAAFVGTGTLAGLMYMQVADWRAERALFLLFASTMANVVAEYLGGSETPTGLGATLVYSTLYLAAAALIIAAVIADRRRDFRALPARTEEGSATSVLPVLAVLLSVAVIIGEHATERGTGEWAAIACTLLGALLVAGREIGSRYQLYQQYRRRAQREAEERLTALVRQSSDVIAIVGPGARLTYVSPASQRVLGLEPSALLDRPATELLGATNAARMTMHLEALATGRRNVGEVDFEIVQPSGQRRVVSVVGSDQRASALIGGIALTIRDVTEQRRAERALLDGATRERQALSSQVHEGIAQDLIGVSLLLETLAGGEARTGAGRDPAIERIIAQIARTIESVRRLAITLSPLHVVRGSLRLAVQNLAAQVSTTSPLQVQLAMRVDESILSQALAEQAYGIVQDAIARAARNATCTRVEVELETTAEELTIAVGSNGLEPENEADDYDAESVRMLGHRVHRLRGNLRLERPLSGGFHLVARIPIEFVAQRWVGG